MRVKPSMAKPYIQTAITRNFKSKALWLKINCVSKCTLRITKIKEILFNVK